MPDEDFADYIHQVDNFRLRRELEEWLEHCDGWLTMIAKITYRKVKRFTRMASDGADDLKQEMILQAYAAIDRFDPNRGVPLRCYLDSTIIRYAFRNDVLKRVALEGCPSDTNMVSKQLYGFADREIRKMQIGNMECEMEESAQQLLINGLESTYEQQSSLERAANVFSLVDALEMHERLLITLRFHMKYQLKDIDEMLGLSRGSTYHRLQTILQKIRSKVSSIDDLTNDDIQSA